MTIALSNFRDALGFFPNGVAIITTIARDRVRNDGEFVQAGSARQRRCAPDHPIPSPHVICPDQSSEQAPQHV